MFFSKNSWFELSFRQVVPVSVPWWWILVEWVVEKDCGGGGRWRVSGAEYGMPAPHSHLVRSSIRTFVMTNIETVVKRKALNIWGENYFNQFIWVQVFLSGFGLWLDTPANGPGAKIPQNSFLNPVKCSRVWHNQPILRPSLEVLCPQALHFLLQSLRWRWWWGQAKGVNLGDKDMWLEEAEGGGSWQQLIRFESLAESFLTLYRSVNFLSGKESFLDLITFWVSLLMIRQCFVSTLAK